MINVNSMFYVNLNKLEDTSEFLNDCLKNIGYCATHNNYVSKLAGLINLLVSHTLHSVHLMLEIVNQIQNSYF